MSKLTDTLRTAMEPLKFLIDRKLDQKIDAEPGKGLSTNDYTNRDKYKLKNMPTNVLVTSEQSLTDAEKTQVKDNIGFTNVLVTSEQSLTDAEKTQVKDNIGVTKQTFGDSFYEINPYRYSYTSHKNSSGITFSTDKVNGVAYECVLDNDPYSTLFWTSDHFKSLEHPHDVRYNPNVDKTVHTRLKYGGGLGCTVTIWFQLWDRNWHEFQILEASSTVRYIGNGYLYDTSLPDTGGSFCVVSDKSLNERITIYSNSRYWPGYNSTKITEWGMHYNDVAYAALDPKYIPFDATLTIENRVADAKATGEAIVAPKEYINLIDQITGFKYRAAVRNGELTSYAYITDITITQPPDKIAYIVGETFDPSGMIVTATLSDGTTKEITDYTTSKNMPFSLARKQAIAISYTTEDDETYTDFLTVTVSAT